MGAAAAVAVAGGEGGSGGAAGVEAVQHHVHRRADELHVDDCEGKGLDMSRGWHLEHGIVS